MVSREREPGSRRERYRVHSDQLVRDVRRPRQHPTRWEDTLRDGVAASARTPRRAAADGDPRLLRVPAEGAGRHDGALARPPQEATSRRNGRIDPGHRDRRPGRLRPADAKSGPTRRRARRAPWSQVHRGFVERSGAGDHLADPVAGSRRRDGWRTVARPPHAVGQPHQGGRPAAVVSPRIPARRAIRQRSSPWDAPPGPSPTVRPSRAGARAAGAGPGYPAATGRVSPRPPPAPSSPRPDRPPTSGSAR